MPLMHKTILMSDVSLVPICFFKGDQIEQYNTYLHKTQILCFDLICFTDENLCFVCDDFNFNSRFPTISILIAVLSFLLVSTHQQLFWFTFPLVLFRYRPLFTYQTNGHCPLSTVRTLLSHCPLVMSIGNQKFGISRKYQKPNRYLVFLSQISWYFLGIFSEFCECSC